MFPNGVMLFLIISGCSKMSRDDSEQIGKILKMSGSEILIGNVNDNENMKDNRKKYVFYNLRQMRCISAAGALFV